jgi:hypothetical protein
MAQKEDNRPFREKYRIFIYPVIAAWLITMFFHPIISHGEAMLPGIKAGEAVVVINKTRCFWYSGIERSLFQLY